jgi:glycosyltransferase involved in cell wall biosynthesis
VRIAERLAADLAATGGTVMVAQHCRRFQETFQATYGHLDHVSCTKWDAVIAFRQPALLPRLSGLFPHARLILWLQDLANARLSHPAIAGIRPKIVTASAFHTRNVLEWCWHRGLDIGPEVDHIFNPIDDDLQPATVDVDQNSLIYFSSPNKGLAWTLEAFRQAHLVIKELRLKIANPGYRVWAPPLDVPPDIEYLGVLSHSVVLREVRGSLCAFHLNDVYPETFGCVSAEANAIGTPVLTHAIGAATEVLTDDRQLIDARDIGAVIDRLLAWRSGDRPVVGPDGRFKTSTVISKWKDLLGIAR